MREPMLTPIHDFVLNPASDGSASLRHGGSDNTFQVYGTSICAQYRFGDHFLVFLQDLSSLDEGVGVFFLSQGDLLDFAQTTQIGLNGDLEDIQITQPDTISFSFPDHMRWRVRCHTRSRPGLHIPTPYTFWERRHMLRSWFTLGRIN
ncbi:hypothetical protein PsAD2_02593 [Pseudovibrio axinellae]|uniref:Uncharacterized protein n=1 Tax=Pseudovibrio axinellae TaxID=989403 RepID=A0A165Y3N9_9HYPH|nr:hypothetical protein [Pseudovibrio axinellae]KZL18409.1 hypothetical protein PsAD2_02593 [Pseudovibrio axinellae]SER89396.1 hypothetical protein SAMN05421798_1532 [Pseudovibrio axinellae]